MLDAASIERRCAWRANPAAVVVGLELSHCVDQAANHARKQGLENVFFVQADLTSPPFRAAAFDFIMSEGVLHHTGDTRAALQALISLLMPNGQIGFYVYRESVEESGITISAEVTIARKRMP